MYKRDSRNKRPSSDDDESPSGDKIEIGPRRFVEVSKFRGAVYVNIREFYMDNGKMLPSKKGIALKIEEWRALVESMEKVEEQIQELRG